MRERQHFRLTSVIGIVAILLNVLLLLAGAFGAATRAMPQEDIEPIPPEIQPFVVLFILITLTLPPVMTGTFLLALYHAILLRLPNLSAFRTSFITYLLAIGVAVQVMGTVLLQWSIFQGFESITNPDMAVLLDSAIGFGSIPFAVSQALMAGLLVRSGLFGGWFRWATLAICGLELFVDVFFFVPRVLVAGTLVAQGIWIFYIVQQLYRWSLVMTPDTTPTTIG